MLYEENKNLIFILLFIVDYTTLSSKASRRYLATCRPTTPTGRGQDWSTQSTSKCHLSRWAAQDKCWRNSQCHYCLVRNNLGNQRNGTVTAKYPFQTKNSSYFQNYKTLRLIIHPSNAVFIVINNSHDEFEEVLEKEQASEGKGLNRCSLVSSWERSIYIIKTSILNSLVGRYIWRANSASKSPFLKLLKHCTIAERWQYCTADWVRYIN